MTSYKIGDFGWGSEGDVHSRSKPTIRKEDFSGNQELSWSCSIQGLLVAQFTVSGGAFDYSTKHLECRQSIKSQLVNLTPVTSTDCLDYS